MLSATERSIQGRIGEPTATDDSRARGAAAFGLLLRQLQKTDKKKAAAVRLRPVRHHEGNRDDQLHRQF